MQAHLNFFHHFLVSHREQDFADGDLGPNFISDTECSVYLVIYHSGLSFIKKLSKHCELLAYVWDRLVLTTRKNVI